MFYGLIFFNSPLS